MLRRLNNSSEMQRCRDERCVISFGKAANDRQIRSAARLICGEPSQKLQHPCSIRGGSNRLTQRTLCVTGSTKHFRRLTKLRLDAGPGEEWNAGSLPLISSPSFLSLQTSARTAINGRFRRSAAVHLSKRLTVADQ
jgi:hypothetical protein